MDPAFDCEKLKRIRIFGLKMNTPRWGGVGGVAWVTWTARLRFHFISRDGGFKGVGDVFSNHKKLFKGRT